MVQPPQTPVSKPRGEAFRDLIMFTILLFWAGYGALSVYQIFRDGTKVLDTLPPFWFWGIPLAPFSALYAPWSSAIKTIIAPPPEAPQTPEPPGGTP